VRNLCLFKRSVFEKLGYADVNFWPGGYFEDNDYCARALRAGVKTCALRHSVYFHFWSRTIHQGGRAGSFHARTFDACRQFYETKWGGNFKAEKWDVPFDGKTYSIGREGSERDWQVAQLPASLRIDSRRDEAAIIDYWREMVS
jgi:hypothetical protein